MRCKACDALLSRRDCSRKSLITNEYLDLCSKCYDTISETLSVEEQVEYGEDDSFAIEEEEE
jgi:hypothetical protein